MARVAGLLLALALVLVLVLDAAGEAAQDNEQVQYRRRRPRTRIPHHRDAPQTPTAPPVHNVRPPPPPPPALRCNDSFAPEDGLLVAGDVCTPVPPPPAPPLPPPRRVVRCPPCTCPKPEPQPLPPRQIPGWPWPVPGGRGGSNVGAGDSGFCVMALAPMMTCGRFITAANDTETETPTPAPTSQCCTGLAGFLRAASAPGIGEAMLRCLCPIILGDVDKTLMNPVDPLRMMALPVACGVVLPPEILYLCFIGRPLPLPVVSDYP